MFEPAEAFQNLRSIVKTLANKKNINLVFEVAPDLPKVFADEAKFKQIMYNLLSNALENETPVARALLPEEAHRGIPG